MMRRACLALVVLNVAGCSGRRGPPEEIVVPRGFTGPVWIVLDPDGRDTPFVNNRYQVVIPANGMLKVQSLKPLQQWHQSSARFDDGSPLPVESGGTPVGPGVVAVRGGGGGGVTTRDGKEIRWHDFFVSTAAQYRNRKNADFPPPRPPT